jgi:hypothetical protein
MMRRLKSLFTLLTHYFQETHLGAFLALMLLSLISQSLVELALMTTQVQATTKDTQHLTVIYLGASK